VTYFTVRYWSRGLPAAAQNYSRTARECLGVVCPVLKLRHVLDGERLFFQTDYQIIRWIYSATDSNGRFMRWEIRLSNFAFAMVLQAGCIAPPA